MLNKGLETGLLAKNEGVKPLSFGLATRFLG